MPDEPYAQAGLSERTEVPDALLTMGGARLVVERVGLWH